MIQPACKLLYKILCISHVTEYGQQGVSGFVQENVDITPCKSETFLTLTELPLDEKIIL